MRQIIINQFERVTANDINDSQLVVQQSLFDDGFYNFFGQSNGFLGPSFSLTRTASNTTAMKKGVGMFYDGTQTGYNPKYTMILAQADIPLTFAAPSSQDRIDLVVVQRNFAVDATASRWVKTGGTGPITFTTVNKHQADGNNFEIVQGTPGVSPVAPATPSGWVAVAQVYIHASTGIVAQGDITDLRSILTLAVSNAGHNIATGTTVQAQLDEIDAFLSLTGLKTEKATYVSSGLYSLVNSPTQKANVVVSVNGQGPVDPSQWDLVNSGGGKAIQFTAGNIPDNAAGDVVEVLEFFGGALGNAGNGGGYVVTQGSGAAGAVQAAATPIGVTNDKLQQQYIKSSGGAVAMTANPQIGNGSIVGQKLIIKGTDDTNYITLADGNGISINGPISLKSKQSIQFDWNGTVWQEDWRTF